jgi:DNA repair ATPase RecN
METGTEGDQLNNLENIILNYDDIQETPPEYLEVNPTSDQAIFETFPKIKIKILSGLNSKDSYVAILSNGELIKRYEDVNIKEKLKNEIENYKKTVSSNAETVTTDRLLINHKKNQDKIAYIKEKHRNAINELQTIHEKNSILNTHIKYFLNKFDYIKSNRILNEKNKQIKLIEYLKEFKNEFTPIMKEFSEINIEFPYLNKLKIELHKFALMRIKLIWSYMIRSKNLEAFLEELNF